MASPPDPRIALLGQTLGRYRIVECLDEGGMGVVFRGEDPRLERAAIVSVEPTAENDRALDWLEKAYAERDGTLVWLKVHPRLDGLRGEPRFRDLLARLRLD